MDSNSAQLFAQAVAAQAEIEAMKARNDLDRLNGAAPSYGADSFMSVKSNLESYIRDLR